jgi:predicted acyltransferase
MIKPRKTPKAAPTAEPEVSSVRTPPSERLVSIDALRGFNMFWIIGGADLLSEIDKAVKVPWFHAISDNLTEHVEWQGVHFHDMIFPLFLFIMGVTAPFSLGRRMDQGHSKGALALQVLKRVAILFLLGLLYNGVLKLPGFEHLRIMGVLQRLALGWGCATLIYLFCSLRGQLAATALLLVGYFAAMRWVPVPGHGAGDFSQFGNFACYLDRLIFAPGQLYKDWGDPEGLFSTLPAIGTAMLGIFAGQWLRTARPPKEKALGLLAAGALLIAAGYAWSPWFPIVKKIWTSSYVLVVGGWSALLLALCYWAIDMQGWKKWAYFFVVIGLNPITIYVGQRFIDFGKMATFFLGGVATHSGIVGPIILAAGALAVKWLFLRYLYKQRIYLRV